MTDPHAIAPGHPGHAHAEHAGPRFQDYMKTFYVLMVLTVASYATYVIMGHGPGSAGIILLLAIFKAALVISIFMHLWFDFRKLYGIIIPVVILCIMATLIFLVDQVVAPQRDAAIAERQTHQHEAQ